MKKNLLIALFTSIFILLTQITVAQISYGPRLGLNMATLAGVNNNAGVRLGLLLGGYGKFSLTDNISFQPEFLYSVKGYASTNNSSSSKYFLKLNYFDIPLLLNFGQSEGVHFLLGLQPSILITAMNKTKSSSSKATIEVTDQVSGFDIAPVLGIGYQAEMGINADLRLSYGIPDILKNNTGNSQHNFLAQLTVGYSFGEK